VKNLGSSMLDLGGLGIQLQHGPKKLKTDEPAVQSCSNSLRVKESDHSALVSLEDDLNDLYDDDCEAGEEAGGVTSGDTSLPLNPSETIENCESEIRISSESTESDMQLHVSTQKKSATATNVVERASATAISSPSAGERSARAVEGSVQFHPVEGVFVWNFPDELLFYLGLRLGWEKAAFCCEVSKKWCSVLRSDALWSTFRSQNGNPSFASASVRHIQVSFPSRFGLPGAEHL
jgi:hypothetical protein